MAHPGLQPVVLTAGASGGENFLAVSPTPLSPQLGSISNGLDGLLNCGIASDINAPRQEVQEQPNGQFQITENGALNLMKAESMDILVVNNLAQDLSVGREQNVAEKADDLTDATLLGDSLNSYHDQETHPQEMLSADNSSFAETQNVLQSADGSFLSSLLQANSDGLGYMDGTNSSMFNTMPEVEVLTSEEYLLEVDDTEDLTTRETTEIFPEIPTNETSLKTDSSESTSFVECQWKGCNSKHTNQEALVNHVNISHIKCEKDEEYKCQWGNCPRKGKGFNARYKILIHIRTHTNEKPHVCKICSKSFARLENLKIHTRTHSGEKPYVCPKPGCNKAYANSSDRFKHVRTHKEDKPYACQMPGCGKRYTDPSSLRKHIRNYGHRTDGTSVSSTIKCSPKQTSPKKTESVSGTVFSFKSGDTTSRQNSQETLLTVIQNAANQKAVPQLVSISGNTIQVTSLVSNPLLPNDTPTKAITPIVIQPVLASVQSADTSTAICKDAVILQSQCPTGKTEEKSQDCPLDLSTYTGFSAENRLAVAEALGVKLPSCCVFLSDQK